MKPEHKIKELKQQLNKVTAEKDLYKNQLEHYKTEKVFSKLANSEERFRMLAESAPAGIAITRNDGDILYLSPRFTEITGYIISDIPTLNNWWPLAYPDPGYRKLMIDKWDKAVNTSHDTSFTVKTVENKVNCKNDGVKDLEFRVATTNGNNYVIITDITERVEAEHKANERLKELNAFYKLGELTEIKGITCNELFSRFIDTLPESLQYPEIAYGRITFNDYDFKTDNYFENGKWVLKSPVIIDGKKSGFVEVGYTLEMPDVFQGPFLKEERQLIVGLAERSGRIVERLKAEENLLYQIRFQKMVAEISSDFIRVNDANIDDIIQSMLERLGHFFQVDRTYLFFFEDGYQSFSNTHEWCSKGTSSVKDTMQHFNTDIIPWWKQQTLKEKSINIPDVEKLPPEASVEKELFRQQNIKSLLTVPVETSKRIIGFFGFDAVKSHKSWDDFQVGFLKVLANTLSDAYAKVDAETKVKESEEKYRLITENASDVIWVLNLKSMRFTYISPAIELLRGLTPEEAMDETLQQAITPESLTRVNKALEENLNDFIKGTLENDYYIDEIQQPCKDGTIIWVEVSTRFRYNKNGEIEVVGVSRNIDDRKKIEAELKKNTAELREINATKDKFFSIISHDLKSPFNSILGMSDLLVENAGKLDVKKLQHYAEVIRDSSESAMELLTNLLDWSRAQTGRMPFNPEKNDVSTVVTDTASLLYESARQKSVSLVNNIPACTFVHADKVLLSTVLRNLMSNAIKFSYSGGKVTVASTTQNGKTIISVSDEGVGIEPETAQKLFRIDENVTTKGTNNEKGTGLGLILCKELVDKHGGEIWVESDPDGKSGGKGSVFYFTV